MSHNLDWVPVAEAQDQPEVVVNDGFGVFDALWTGNRIVSFADGDVELATHVGSGTVILADVTVADRALTLPALPRLYQISADILNTEPIKVVRGTSSITFAPGEGATVYADGTDNGLLLFAVLGAPIVVTSGGAPTSTGGVPEAPNNANAYVRKGAAWVVGITAADFGTLTARVDTIMAGANTGIDTFLEAYNRFLTDESAASAMQTAIDGKAPIAQAVPTGGTTGYVLTKTSGGFAWAAPTGGGTLTGIVGKDEGTTTGTFDTINFTGTGVTATFAGTTLTVNIPGATGGGATTLDGLTDVDVSTATDGQYLKRVGANWVGAAAPAGGSGTTSTVIPPVSLTGPSAPAGYAATASSEFSSSYPAWAAFDGTTGAAAGGRWASNAKTAPQWVMLQVPVAKQIDSYTIKAHGYQPDLPQNPSDWVLEGSNDNATFTALSTQTGITWTTAGESKSFPVTDTGTYTYFRFRPTAAPGSLYSVGELSFNEYIAPVTFNLDDLDDVHTAGATDGQALVYDSATNTWGPETVSGGGGSTTPTPVATTFNKPGNYSATSTWSSTITGVVAIQMQAGDVLTHIRARAKTTSANARPQGLVYADSNGKPFGPLLASSVAGAVVGVVADTDVVMTLSTPYTATTDQTLWIGMYEPGTQWDIYAHQGFAYYWVAATGTAATTGLNFFTTRWDIWGVGTTISAPKDDVLRKEYGAVSIGSDFIEFGGGNGLLPSWVVGDKGEMVPIYSGGANRVECQQEYTLNPTIDTVGVTMISTGASTSGRTAWCGNNGGIDAKFAQTFVASANIGNLSTSTERFIAHLGALAMTGAPNAWTDADANTGFGFRYTDADSPNWVCYSKSGGVVTNVITSFPVAATQPVRLRADFTPGVDIKYYINGKLVATITTNLPLGQQKLRPVGSIVKTAGTTSRAYEMDYIQLRSAVPILR